jgi:hypothetical protein
VDAILRFQGPGERVAEAEDHFSLFVAFDAVKDCALFNKSFRDTVSLAPPISDRCSTTAAMSRHPLVMKWIQGDADCDSTLCSCWPW